MVWIKIDKNLFKHRETAKVLKTFLKNETWEYKDKKEDKG